MVKNLIGLTVFFLWLKCVPNIHLMCKALTNQDYLYNYLVILFMKKALLLLTMLVGCISTLWADGTITVTSGNPIWTSNEGTYASNNSTVWTSNAAGKPTVTITGQSQKNANAWNKSNGILMCNTGDGELTLTIAIAGNYRITGFSITAQNAWGGAQEVRFSSNGQNAQGTSGIQLNITGLYTTSTTLTALAVTTGERAKITNFVVNYTEHTEYISNVEADIKPYMDAAADQLFYLTSAGKAAVTAAGYDPAATTYNETQYNAMLDARNANICYPETGTYFFINKLYPEYYMYRDNAGTLLCSNARTAENAAYMITLIKTGDNVYKISAQGKYVGSQSAANTAFPCTADAGGETFSFSDVNSTYLGLGCLVGKNSYNNGDYSGALHCNGSKKVVNWNPAGEASWWTITPATSIQRTFDESGYLTLNYPFNIEKPSGVEFYDATGISANEVTMTAVSGNVLAANHPVIAYRSEKAGDVAFNITTVDGTAKPGTSFLEGTLAPASPDDASRAYILVGTTAADTRFAKLDEADAVISANRAYLSYASGGSVRELGLNFGVTAIKGVAEGVQKQDSVFDLQGRRVEKPSKGLYIVNGKKVLF